MVAIGEEPVDVGVSAAAVLAPEKAHAFRREGHHQSRVAMSTGAVDFPAGDAVHDASLIEDVEAAGKPVHVHFSFFDIDGDGAEFILGGATNAGDFEA
ncbi:MAG: hypothetical protein ACK5TG_15500 [Planctomyces sp.]|jgi:hypothetical protein